MTTYSKIVLPQLHKKCIFYNFFVSSISSRPIDLPLLKEFSKSVSFSNNYILPVSVCRPEALDIHDLAHKYEFGEPFGKITRNVSRIRLVNCKTS